MTWRGASAHLVALRVMIQACPSWIDAGGAEAQVHYPSMDAEDDETFPRVCLFEEMERQAVGTGMSLPQSRYQLDLHAYGRLKKLVTTVNLGAQQFTVGSDVTADVAVGDEFFIAGSTGNDGWYRCATISFGAGATTIGVTAARELVEATADGAAYLGSVEDLADRIASELLLQPTGCALRGGGRQGQALHPADTRQFGEDLTDQHVQTTLTFDGGLSA